MLCDVKYAIGPLTVKKRKYKYKVGLVVLTRELPLQSCVSIFWGEGGLKRTEEEADQLEDRG